MRSGPGLAFLSMLVLAPVPASARDAVGAADRALSDIVVMPRRISIDDSGVHADRNALITTYRDVTDPKGMTVSAYFLQDVTGDNQGFKGAAGVYIQTRDKPGIRRDQRGVLYGAAITLIPSFDRDHYPSDDVTGVVVQNDGVGRGTEAVYIGRGSHNLAQGDWLAAFGADAWADTGLYLRGHYRFGIDLATPGFNSVLSGAALRVPARAPSIITVRNSQDKGERSILATREDGTLLIDGGQVRGPTFWTPVASAEKGRIGVIRAIAASTRYSIINHRCFADFTLYVEDAGTAAGALRLDLPVPAATDAAFVASGQRSTDSVMLVGRNISNTLRITRYDGQSPFLSKTYVTMSFNYEVEP
ncbi:hypothetical protein [Sphingobium sp. HWE2-09]|uniref:hypothetical protein n=1 Tax=Sphingobium sp. HWE2-09 TaxID=3108390 RepID=UPI002DCEDFD0|nr:hypothetical protein [Sphingobium sp. HWE2-09]